MMGMLAPVEMEICRTIPWTGLFSAEDLSIPGGVKPERMGNSIQNSETSSKTNIERAVLLDATFQRINRADITGQYQSQRAVGL